MKKLTKILAIILTLTLLCACTSEAKQTSTSSVAPSSQEIASEFVKVWQSEYETIKSTSMTLPEGKAFLWDLTGDNLSELFFLYSNYKTSGVYVYDISDIEIKCLGNFTTSSYDNEDIIFKIYGEKENKILYTQEILYGAFSDNRNFITDKFISFVDGNIHIDELSKTEYTDATPTEYYSSPQSSVKITKEEYSKKIDDIIGNLTLTETIVLPQDEPICEFDDDKKLKDYILNLLNEKN